MKTKQQYSTYNLNNKTKLHNDDDDDDYNHRSDKFLGYHEHQQVLSHITVALDEDIMGPKYYRHVLSRISDLDENDSVEFRVDTNGGNLQGIISLIHAIQRTEAHVHCHIDGVAASAGSLLALSCPSVSVAPYATLMIHPAHGFTGGTLSNSAAYSTFVNNETRKLMTDAYSGFLTPDELEDVFKGRELWFCAEEIVERLQRKQEYLQSLQDEQECSNDCDDCTGCKVCQDNLCDN